MMRFSRWAVLAVALGLPGALLAQSKPWGIDPGRSTMKDVRSRIGMPSVIKFNTDGEEVWEYNNNPTGFHAYRIVFGTDNVVKSARRIRVDADRLQIKPGMTPKELVEIMGEPSLIYFIRNRLHWEWRLHYFGNQRHRLVAEFDEDYKLKSTALIGAQYRGSGTTHGYGGLTP